MSDLTLNLTQTRPDGNNLRTNGPGLRTGRAQCPSPARKRTAGTQVRCPRRAHQSSRSREARRGPGNPRRPAAAPRPHSADHRRTGRSAQLCGARPRRPGSPRRSLRPRPPRAAAQGRHHQRHPGEHLQPVSTWSAAAFSAAPVSPSATIATCCRSSTRSSPPSAAAWTSRRPWSTPASRTAPASTPLFRRWPSTAPFSPSAASAPRR